jgi:hypothetical protein
MNPYRQPVIVALSKVILASRLNLSRDALILFSPPHRLHTLQHKRDCITAENKYGPSVFAFM